MEYSKQTIKKIIANKKKLENKLKVKINIKQDNIELSGEQLNIYVAEQVLEAINKNFSVNSALLLTNEDYILEDINIK